MTAKRIRKAPVPTVTRGPATMYCGDMRDVVPTLGKFTACVTDPPYELGFMGKAWDKSGIAFDPKTWKVVLDAVVPGGMLLAFGGTRTFHRMACAIEDAGWEIRDCVMWLYSQGFPKSLDISKAIDKSAGAERKVVGKRRGQGHIPNDRGKWGLKENIPVDITVPATDAAKLWDGYGTALKPAQESVLVAQKPYEEVQHWNQHVWYVAGPSKRFQVKTRNVVLTPVLMPHAGGLAVVMQIGKAGGSSVRMVILPSALRLGSIDWSTIWSSSDTSGDTSDQTKTSTTSTSAAMITDSAIWNFIQSQITYPNTIRAKGKKQRGQPSAAFIVVSHSVGGKTSWQVIQDHSAHVIATDVEHISLPDALAPEYEPIIVAMKPLDGTFAGNALEHGVAGINVDGGRIGTEQTYTIRTGKSRHATSFAEFGKAPGKYINPPSRWPANVILDEDAAAHLDKQSGHSTTRPTNNHITRTECATGNFVSGTKVTHGSLHNDSGGASRFFYTAKVSRSERQAGLEMLEKNMHPTVKPVDLMRYLIRLVTMPKNTRILDPFAGSGPTLIACKQLDIDCVGVTLDTEDCKIADGRLSRRIGVRKRKKLALKRKRRKGKR